MDRILGRILDRIQSIVGSPLELPSDMAAASTLLQQARPDLVRDLREAHLRRLREEAAAGKKRLQDQKKNTPAN